MTAFDSRWNITKITQYRGGSISRPEECGHLNRLPEQNASSADDKPKVVPEKRKRGLCEVYERIDKRVRPPVEKPSCLIGPGGSPISGKKATLEMHIGQVKIIKEAVVAGIEHDVVLGFDVLWGGENGPSDILPSKGKLVMNGSEISCIQIGGEVNAKKVRG